MGDEEERLDVAGEIEALDAALVLQHRSVLAYARLAGSLLGFEFQGMGDTLWRFAEAEIRDLRVLVEKAVTLGANPTTEVAPLDWHENPRDAFRWMIACEEECLDALQAAIEPTGREAQSEAIEHMLEHVIVRKQGQLDLLIRACGR